MRKYYNIFIFLLLLTNSVVGQQESLYTQFAFNKMVFNPAFAGQTDKTSIVGVIRNQWSGINKAPSSQLISANLKAFPSRWGLGFVIEKNEIGVQSRIAATSHISYSLPIKNGFLKGGLSLTSRRYIQDFTDPDLVALDGFDLDPNINREKYTSQVFNTGFGLLYQSKTLYAGFAIPRIFDLRINRNNLFNDSREERHYYAMFGSEIKLDGRWKYHPQLFLKLTNNSPFNLDFLSLFSYNEKIYLGLNLRSGGSQNTMLQSTDIIMGFNFSKEIFLGMSYDFNLSGLREFENGSFEVLLTYHFQKSQIPKRINNPRYFSAL